MEVLEVKGFYIDSMQSNCEVLHKIAEQIKGTARGICTTGVSNDDMKVLFDNIESALSYWVGNTYVGHPKETSIKNAFQHFFEELYFLLLTIRGIKDESIQEFVDAALYHGKLYRYLGHSSGDRNYKKRIVPEYNDIYVSWSKNTENDYLRSKLPGTLTVITCEVKEPHDGIDLSAFGISLNKESEVVFPTIKETITNIEYRDWR